MNGIYRPMTTKLKSLSENNNAQPNYFVIGHNEKALTDPISYSKVDEFVNFLDEGLKNFRQQELASKR